jgi:hypothetical protein
LSVASTAVDAARNASPCSTSTITYRKDSTPNAPLSVDGNATLQVNLTDRGEPGGNDTIAITVWNKSGGLWFSSRWNGTTSLEQLLGGGNLIAH